MAGSVNDAVAHWESNFIPYLLEKQTLEIGSDIGIFTPFQRCFNFLSPSLRHAGLTYLCSV